jgi:hypothetical protein
MIEPGCGILGVGRCPHADVGIDAPVQWTAPASCSPAEVAD